MDISILDINTGISNLLNDKIVCFCYLFAKYNLQLNNREIYHKNFLTESR